MFIELRGAWHGQPARRGSRRARATRQEWLSTLRLTYHSLLYQRARAGPSGVSFAPGQVTARYPLKIWDFIFTQHRNQRVVSTPWCVSQHSGPDPRQTCNLQPAASLASGAFSQHSGVKCGAEAQPAQVQRDSPGMLAGSSLARHYTTPPPLIPSDSVNRLYTPGAVYTYTVHTHLPCTASLWVCALRVRKAVSGHSAHLTWRRTCGLWARYVAHLMVLSVTPGSPIQVQVAPYFRHTGE